MHFLLLYSFLIPHLLPTKTIKYIKYKIQKSNPFLDNHLPVSIQQLIIVFVPLILINYNKIIKMGNQSCSLPRIMSKEFQVPDLKGRSSYGQNKDLPDQNIVRAIFNQSYNANRKSMVAKKIEDSSDQLFEDEKFKLDSKECSRLSVLFDFQRMNTRIYSKKGQVDLTSFIQLNIEFCYLTCVFYLLCRQEARASLMKQIIETQQTNLYGAYSLNFFCNGEKHPIIIDDKMPTNSDSFVYLRIMKGIELWPLILEKAWCKQIGSYEKAKGLSPEDAFEEITGIPAYSNKFRSDNRSIIKNMLVEADREKYWVALVARNGLEDLKNRQVFYLQSIQNERYTIISPHSQFKFQNYKFERRGQVKVSQQDIFTHFEHVVIGFYKKGYTNTSLAVQCKSHEQLFFSLIVKKEEEISIRFNQFYEGYLDEEQRLNYQYSPILIQLYKVNQNAGVKGQHTLIYDCQGCNRSLAGARSSHCSKNILQVLEGKYYIRMQVQWQHESLLKKGNLVIYSSENNVELTQLKNNGQMTTQVYKDFFDRRIPKENINILNEHNLQVRMFDKLNTILLCFKNLINSSQSFEIDFSKSKNVLIRGGKVSGQKTTLSIEGQQSVIIELVPLHIRQGIIFQAFDITKIEKRQ